MTTFDELMHAGATAPEGFALYDKNKARQYIAARHAAIAQIRDVVLREDMTDSQKIALLKLSPGIRLR